MCKNPPRDTIPNTHHPESRRRKLVRRSKCPQEGRHRKLEALGAMIYGRLLISTKICPCVKSAGVTLDTAREIRIGQSTDKTTRTQETHGIPRRRNSRRKGRSHIWKNRQNYRRCIKDIRPGRNAIRRLEENRTNRNQSRRKKRKEPIKKEKMGEWG